MSCFNEVGFFWGFEVADDYLNHGDMRERLPG